MDKLYAGVDLHKRFSVITVLDKEGTVIEEAKIETDNEKTKAFFAKFETEMDIAAEATFNAEWFHTLMDGEGGKKVVLANPSRTKAIGSGAAKTDRIDAKMLADLLRSNMLPRSVVPNERERTFQEMIRYRHFLVRIQTMLKNRIHSYLHRCNIKYEHVCSDLFGVKGLAYLSSIQFPSRFQEHVKLFTYLLEQVRSMITEATKQIITTGKEVKEITLLQTIPGIGPHIAMLIMGEIKDITRFVNGKRLCSFAGLVPRIYQSADMKRTGHITKQGSRYLRWGMSEAVQRLRYQDSQLGKQYRRYEKKKGTNMANIIMARKLLLVIYQMLTTTTPYQAYPHVNAGHSS